MTIINNCFQQEKMQVDHSFVFDTGI